MNPFATSLIKNRLAGARDELRAAQMSAIEIGRDDIRLKLEQAENALVELEESLTEAE